MLRDLLFSLGFPDVWYPQTVRDADVFLSLLKQRIKDQFIQSWNSRLHDSSRALFYNTIADFKFQPYLNVLTIPKFRKSLSRLRVSSHRLCIETGRWHKPRSTPIGDRKCTICEQ